VLNLGTAQVGAVSVEMSRKAILITGIGRIALELLGAWSKEHPETSSYNVRYGGHYKDILYRGHVLYRGHSL
jgi:hypothetical protein